MTSTLLADIGGTNIRFGLLQKGKIEKKVLYPHEKGLTAAKAVKRYLLETKAKPTVFVAGLAGPLLPKGRITLSNRPFTLNMPQICRQFGFKKGLIANDMIFHALGVSDQPDTKRACIIFVGTGLGVSYICNGIAHATEMCHERLLRPRKEEKLLHAEVWEDIISGPAFLNIYRNLEGTYKPVEHSREVSYLAHNVRDKNAVLTYKIIARCLARLCVHIARTEKVSVFFLGGQLIEILRLPVGQNTFFDGLGKWADIMGVRIIRPSEQTAMKGLKLVADELKEIGTSHRIRADEFFVV